MYIQLFDNLLFIRGPVNQNYEWGRKRGQRRQENSFLTKHVLFFMY